MRTKRLLLVALAAATMLTACGNGASDEPSMSLTVGYTAIGAAYSDLYVCEDKGVFKKNGLDVKLTRLNSSSQLLASLSSNSVNIGAGVASSTAAGILRGVDLRYVALPMPVYYLEMWGKPELKSDDDLKGKKVGLSSPGSLGDAAFHAWLADKGMDGQVEPVYLKNVPAEVAALEQGAVDAIVTQPPNGTQTRDKGFEKIRDFTEYPAAANAYTTTGEYLEVNSKAVQAFVKSEVECLSILHQDKKQAIESIRKHSGQDDESLAEYSYDFFVKLWSKEPRVHPELIKAAFEDAAEETGKPVPADTDKYVDNSFLDKLKKDGYIDDLYQGEAG
ncbi:MAG: transporter substrate-binding domain-containing protein [Actinophytocola sp.]|uniref:ABC transporter substrate-binding protein n=1 Tax=Actinophytocola sp. TaxID=1872138 RepID=UPI0013274183|nr:ABC transporter substrate-binding protein [Actinophytocola sp.]MPZ84628.1 transporter substrate-binding domain-containing protein [Actinophytocola sp.]